VNEMSTKLCRLESIRRVTDPWQQQAIDRVASTVNLLADNTQGAIEFMNNHRQELWSSTYKNYVNNLYTDANHLSNSVSDFIQYAQARDHYRTLRNELGLKSSS
jgi:hypothetical protein